TSPVHPTPTKINEVAIKVAIVIPEIGFDDEPIIPTILDETVTKKNPKIIIITADKKFVGMFGIRAIKKTSSTLPIITNTNGISLSVLICSTFVLFFEF